MLQTNPDGADVCCSCGHTYHSIPDQLRLEGTSKNSQKPPKSTSLPLAVIYPQVLPKHLKNYLGLVQVNSTIFWLGCFFKKISLRRHFRLNIKTQNIFRRLQKWGRNGCEREAGKYKLALLQWSGIPWLHWAFPSALFLPWELPKSLRHSLIPKKMVKFLSKEYLLGLGRLSWSSDGFYRNYSHSLNDQRV